jgi:hypothetical protein
MRRSLFLVAGLLLGCGRSSLLPDSVPVDDLSLPSATPDLSVSPSPDLATGQIPDLLTRDLNRFDLNRPDLLEPDLLNPDLSQNNCGDNDVLIGTACVKRSCQVGDNRLYCELPDGGIGHCAALTCTTVDFDTDPNNCGSFGNVCPAGTPCTSGFCYGACTTMSCPTGMICSAYGCVLPGCDGQHDYQACPPYTGQYIYARQCCGTTCTDLMNDAGNCGYCGHQCPGTAACVYGVCGVDCSSEIDSTPCWSGSGYCCQGQCVIWGSGCGCGVKCWSNCASRGGCPSGTACVSNGPLMDVCAPTSCAGLPEGSDCAANDADGAPQPGNCCGGSCALLATDTLNCGACGRVCPAGEVCLRSQCVPPVACINTTDATPCLLPDGVTGMCCSGSCVDVHTDDANCGYCAQTCPTGSTCHGVSDALGGGQCQDASGRPLTCPTAPCAPGHQCVGNICRPVSCAGLADATPCANGRCCGGTCTSIGDLSNCGSCGRACPTGAGLCLGGLCFSASGSPFACSATAPCPSGNTCISVTCPPIAPSDCTTMQCFPSSCAGRSDGVPCAFGPEIKGTCCAGACVNIDRDLANCGQCGRDCGNDLCAAGTCQVAAESSCVAPCPPGTLCYQVGPIGGGSPMGVCVGPVCGLITYNNPQLNSGRCLAQDGQLGLCCSDGTCADIASDPINCGGCGIDCAGAPCVNGSCVGAQCGYAQEGGFCGAGKICDHGQCR